VRSEAEAAETYARLGALVDRFLGITLRRLPCVPWDPSVPAATAQGKPLVIGHPDAPAAHAIREVARDLLSRDCPPRSDTAPRLFSRRITPRRGAEV
jgi:MinD-like ATPase involved in chromosome partitioning or flagellar assembly